MKHEKINLHNELKILLKEKKIIYVFLLHMVFRLEDFITLDDKLFYIILIIIHNNS